MGTSIYHQLSKIIGRIETMMKWIQTKWVHWNAILFLVPVIELYDDVVYFDNNDNNILFTICWL